jgi:hypothetical protein
MYEGPKPTIGRIVHFFTDHKPNQFNGQGAGPYPAMICQVWSGSGANLKVFPSMGEPFDAGSVMHISERQEGQALRHWDWPPREETPRKEQSPESEKPADAEKAAETKIAAGPAEGEQSDVPSGRTRSK